jgi:hypothetical protein
MEWVHGNTASHRVGSRNVWASLWYDTKMTILRLVCINITLIPYSRMSSSRFWIAVAVRRVNNEQFLWLKGIELQWGGRREKFSNASDSNMKAILLQLIANCYFKVWKNTFLFVWHDFEFSVKILELAHYVTVIGIYGHKNRILVVNMLIHFCHLPGSQWRNLTITFGRRWQKLFSRNHCY